MENKVSETIEKHFGTIPEPRLERTRLYELPGTRSLLYRWCITERHSYSGVFRLNYSATGRNSACESGLTPNINAVPPFINHKSH